MLDPVRFITNLSTGEMGYAIAREAKRRGFKATLLSGPTGLVPPKGIRFVPFVTVADLERELKQHFGHHDILIMSAAVGDFIPVKRASKKIPRQERWAVSFRKAPDLVRKLAKQKGERIVIGFSLETEDWLARSQRKREAKHLDGMVANYYSKKHNPFGKTRVHVAFIDKRRIQMLHAGSKEKLAVPLLDWVLTLADARIKN